jgi:1,6-anhydro-N-acetylmuramate kinase
MPRGGKRENAGRRKTERPVDANVARKIKAKVKAEEKWVRLIEIAMEKAEKFGHTSDLRQALEYLDDRDLGRPVDTVNHLHDQPLQVNATLTLGEGMKLAMQKAEARVRAGK